MMRWALWLLLASLTWTAGAQPPVTTPQISLLTFQPGELYWQRYGHNALRVIETRGERVYNYGIFDFQQKNFALNFARGRMQYRLATEPIDYTLAVYAHEGRWVHEQVLDFTPQQARRVAQFLARNALPGNAEYRYDYFTANCSTKVRDVIDLGMDGALESAWVPVMTRASYRSDAARMMSPMPPMMWFTDALLGQSTDQPINLWQRSFLPEVLMDAVRGARFADGRPLVRSERQLAPGRLAATPIEPPMLVMPFAVAGLALAGMMWLMAFLSRHTSRPAAVLFRRINGGLVLLMATVSGLVGWVLLLGWTVTDHLVMADNLSLLAFSPLSLLGLPLMIRGLWRAPQHMKYWMLMLLAAPALGTTLALVLQLGADAQQHLHWLLFWLPVHVATLAVLRKP